MRRFAFTSMPRGSAAIIAAIVLGVLVGRASGSPLASFVPYVAGFSSPVYVTSAPGDPATLYVVEQAGTIKIVKSRHITGTFLDIHSIVKSGGELGLLSMAFSPHYATNHLFYVSYDDLNGNSRVTQYRSSNGVGVPSSARILLAVRQPYSNHKGGQLQFDKRGYLYIEVTHAHGCSVTGGYVYRGTAVPLARGRYFYGDYCAGTIWSFPVGPNGRAGSPRESGHVPSLSSFGLDGNRNLYAVSLDGTLYRLAS